MQTTLQEKRSYIQLILFTVTAVIPLLSNLAAIKLWNLFGIAVDGGIIVFPISYVIGDILAEIYGKKIANSAINLAFFINIAAVSILLLVTALPAYPNWEGQEAYASIFLFAPRITLASLLGFLASQHVNNFFFVKIKNSKKFPKLYQRALGSSIIARFFDIIIFETIAFLGVLSFQEFLFQAIFAYFAGILLESVFTPVTYLLVKKLKRYLKIKTPSIQNAT